MARVVFILSRRAPCRHAVEPYSYPQRYIEWFGPDYAPPPVIRQAYEYARNHKWYMSARHVTVNGFYSFDPNTKVEIEEFGDLIGRKFRQPGGPRQRSQPVFPHVADDHRADSVPVEQTEPAAFRLP